MSKPTEPPISQEEEEGIIVSLAQKYAVGNLPHGVALSEATRPQLLAAIKKGMRKSR